MKSIVSHGISIGLERMSSDFFLHVKATGMLGHADYEMIPPLIECVLQCVAHPEVKVLFDARDFRGWEVGSPWEDFTLDLEHRNKFSRIAILGRANWQQVSSSIASWFTSGEARYFEDRDAALMWLSQAEEGARTA